MSFVRFAKGRSHKPTREKASVLPAIKERDIEAACVQILELDGWRPFKMEQNYSERKRKVTGEKGIADHLFIRYWAGIAARKPEPHDRHVNALHLASGNEVMFVEFKRPTGKSGKSTKAAPHQKIWHRDERLRGALTLIAGEDFQASVDGFHSWYRSSGLMRKSLI